MRPKYLLCVIPLLLVGCQAGTSYELLGYDAIQLAAVEAKKGVVAYDTAIRLGAEKDKAEYLIKLGRDVVKIALSRGETPESAKTLAEAIVTGAAKHMAGQTEQERRRAAWFAVTVDNLQYIVETAEDSKQFAIYRADVSAQWKSYLQAQARTRLAKLGAGDVPAPPAPQPQPPPKE